MIIIKCYREVAHEMETIVYRIRVITLELQYHKI